MRTLRFLTSASTVVGLSVAGTGSAAAPPADGPGSAGTVLGIAGSHFTLSRAPTFLLGFSAYGALGASEKSLGQDLTAFQRLGFNWLRVWATWSAFGDDVSAVGADGQAREPFFGRLQWLVAECDRRGVVVDVTLARARPTPGRPPEGGLPDLEAHRRAVEALLTGLRPHRNWYLDLANERDVRDARYVPAEELRELRELARRLDPDRLVTASFGGHDLSEADLREAVVTIGVDFLAVHRPRAAGSPGQTEARTRAVLAHLQDLGRVVPVHHQEPFRRGYGQWEPVAADFLADLRGAVAGGAAGWCFHNGAQRGAAEGRPRRSFDLREAGLFEQLDTEELAVVRAAAQAITSRPEPETPEWITRAVVAPRVQFQTFDSAAARGPVSYHLYTPEGYDAQPGQRFPVLYWLHGSGGGLPGIAPLAARFHGAIRAGKVPPMLVVFPNGLELGLWVDSADGRTPVETVLVRELLPRIDSTWRTQATREGRIVEGFSMGGYGAARLMLRYPELFGAASILAGGPLQQDFTVAPRAGPRGREEVLERVFGGSLDAFRAQSPWVLAETAAAAVRGRTLIRQAIGELDETLPANRAFDARLTELQIPHAFTVLPGVGHNPTAVLDALGEGFWAFYRQAFGRGQPAPPPGG